MTAVRGEAPRPQVLRVNTYGVGRKFYAECQEPAPTVGLKRGRPRKGPPEQRLTDVQLAKATCAACDAAALVVLDIRDPAARDDGLIALVRVQRLVALLLERLGAADGPGVLVQESDRDIRRIRVPNVPRTPEFSP